jgi:hypothetical protein
MNAPGNWIVPRRIVHETGVRSGALADVQLVCRAGPYELDILVREHADPVGLQIVGQVTLGGRIYEPAAHVHVELVEALAPVAATDTDDFGEFEIGSRNKDRVYGLKVGEADDAPCVLVWEGGPA